MLRFSLQPAAATFDITRFDPIDRKHVASTAEALKDGFNHGLPESAGSEHWADLHKLILSDSLSFFARNNPRQRFGTTALFKFAEPQFLKLDRPGLTALASDNTLNSRVA